MIDADIVQWIPNRGMTCAEHQDARMSPMLSDDLRSFGQHGITEALAKNSFVSGQVAVSTAQRSAGFGNEGLKGLDELGLELNTDGDEEVRILLIAQLFRLCVRVSLQKWVCIYEYASIAI